MGGTRERERKRRKDGEERHGKVEKRQIERVKKERSRERERGLRV